MLGGIIVLEAPTSTVPCRALTSCNSILYKTFRPMSSTGSVEFRAQDLSRSFSFFGAIWACGVTRIMMDMGTQGDERV